MVTESTVDTNREFTQGTALILEQQVQSIGIKNETTNQRGNFSTLATAIPRLPQMIANLTHLLLSVYIFHRASNTILYTLAATNTNF